MAGPGQEGRRLGRKAQGHAYDLTLSIYRGSSPVLVHFLTTNLWYVGY